MTNQKGARPWEKNSKRVSQIHRNWTQTQTLIVFVVLALAPQLGIGNCNFIARLREKE